MAPTTPGLVIARRDADHHRMWTRALPLLLALAMGAACGHSSVYDAALFQPNPALRGTVARLVPIEPPTPIEALAVRAADAQRTQEFNFTDDLTPLPRNRIDYGELPPPEFMRLSRRAREQWHACRVFFVRDGLGGGQCGVGREERRRFLSVSFPVTVRDYVAQPDGRARRAFLERNGCPAGLIDVADGTHLDLVERAAD